MAPAVVDHLETGGLGLWIWIEEPSVMGAVQFGEVTEVPKRGPSIMGAVRFGEVTEVPKWGWPHCRAAFAGSSPPCDSVSSSVK